MAIVFQRRAGERIVTPVERGGEFIAEDRPALSREVFGESVEQCTFCGEPHAAALWHGYAGCVTCCRSCAEKVLPRLAADAIVGERGDHANAIGHVRGALDRFLGEFWQGVACAQANLMAVARRERPR